MWVSSAAKTLFPNADRISEAAAIAALVVPEEKNEQSEITPSSSTGAGNTAPVSRIAGGGGGGGGSASRRSGVQQLAEEKKIEIAVTNLANDISNLEVEILGVERAIDEAQQAVATESVYRGRRGDALKKEVERLALKEQQLRHKERQMRDEKIVILRRPSLVTWAEPAGSASITTQKRVSFIETHAHPNDPEQEKIERRRVMTVKKIIRQRSTSSSGYTTGDEAGNDTVITLHKAEEDPRLLAKLGSFQAPIVVSTLLAGFTLVLFDVSEGKLSRQLALLSFACEVTASTVLSLIVYHGQNLYSYSSDMNPLTRKFISRTAPMIVFALVAFALGVFTFVAAFVIEASEGLGISWMAIMLVLFFPTVIAAVLFTYSTVLIKSRYSINKKVPAVIQPGE